MYDEIIRRKEIGNYQKFKFLFFIFFSFGENLIRRKTFFIETHTIQYKTDYIRFAQKMFCTISQKNYWLRLYAYDVD